MPVLLALVLMQSATAHATDFSGRVSAARALEANGAGHAYQTRLWARIGSPMTNALQGCITSNAPADRSPFTLAADVQTDGLPTHIQVQPATPVATCLAGQFAAWPLPAPPDTPRPYAIEIDVSVVK